MSETPDNAHRLAAEKHAEKRAADRIKRAAKARTGTAKPPKPNRVKETPLDSHPGLELTPAQRQEVGLDRWNEHQGDNAASLARESAPTPLAQQRQAYSAAKLAALQARKETRTPDGKP